MPATAWCSDVAGARTRRRLVLQMAVAAVAGVGSLAAVPAHAGYNIFTGEYSVPQAELQARIETRFPLRLNYAQVFDVQVTKPRLGLDAGSKRAGVTVDLLVRSPLLARPLAGVLVISSKLRYDAGTRSVRLVEPNADRIDFQGLAADDARQLQAIGQVVAQQALQDYPLHTFQPEDLRYGNRVFTPGEIFVADGAIVVKLD